MAIVTTRNIKTGDELASAIASTSNVLVDFYKDNCQPCKMVELLLKQVEDKSERDLTILKVRLEIVGEEVFRDYEVRSTPTLMFFKDGKMVRSNPGLMNTVKLLESIKDHF